MSGAAGANASASTFLDEWSVRRQIQCIQDKDGYLYCGRREDMPKVGGVYVAAFEVEGVESGIQSLGQCPTTTRVAAA